MATDCGECVNDSVIQEEIEVLESIYVNELEIERDASGHPLSLCLQLHPSTGDDHDKRFVCMTLLLQLPDQYPDDIPEVIIRNPRGLGEEELQSLHESINELAEERKGGPMLYEIIELAKESLTEGNIPHCPCMICLEHFSEGDNFTRTECYHYFHCHCLARYVTHTRQVQKEEEKYRVWHQSRDEEEKIPCPVCREHIDYDLDALSTSKPQDDGDEIIEINEDIRKWQREMAAKFAAQKDKGGIIDLEAEKNKFLLSLANMSSLSRTASGSNLENLNKESSTQAVKVESSASTNQGGRGKNTESISYRNSWKSRLKSAPSNNRKQQEGRSKSAYNDRRDFNDNNNRYNYHDRRPGSRNDRDYRRYDIQRNDTNDWRSGGDENLSQQAEGDEFDTVKDNGRTGDQIRNGEGIGSGDRFGRDRKPRNNASYRDNEGRQNFTIPKSRYNDKFSRSGYKSSRDHPKHNVKQSINGKSESDFDVDDVNTNSLKRKNEGSENVCEDSVDCDITRDCESTQGQTDCSQVNTNAPVGDVNAVTERTEEVSLNDTADNNSTSEGKEKSNIQQTSQRKYDENRGHRGNFRNYNDYNDHRGNSRKYADYNDPSESSRKYNDGRGNSRKYDYNDRRGNSRKYDDYNDPSASSRKYNDRRGNSRKYDDYNDHRGNSRKSDDYNDSRGNSRKYNDYNDHRGNSRKSDDYNDRRGNSRRDNDYNYHGENSKKSDDYHHHRENSRKFDDYNERRGYTTKYANEGQEKDGQKIFRRDYKEGDSDSYRNHDNRRGSGRGSRRSGLDNSDQSQCKEHKGSIDHGSSASAQESRKHYSEEKWQENGSIPVKDGERDCKDNYNENVTVSAKQNDTECWDAAEDISLSQNHKNVKGRMQNGFSSNEKDRFQGDRTGYSKQRRSYDHRDRKGQGFGRPKSEKHMKETEDSKLPHSLEISKQRRNDCISSQSSRQKAYEITGGNISEKPKKLQKSDSDIQGSEEAQPQLGQSRPPPGFENVKCAYEKPKTVEPPPGFS